jgi:hypothetical protein
MGGVSVTGVYKYAPDKMKIGLSDEKEKELTELKNSVKKLWLVIALSNLGYLLSAIAYFLSNWK